MDWQGMLVDGFARQTRLIGNVEWPTELAMLTCTINCIIDYRLSNQEHTVVYNINQVADLHNKCMSHWYLANQPWCL